MSPTPLDTVNGGLEKGRSGKRKQIQFGTLRERSSIYAPVPTITRRLFSTRQRLRPGPRIRYQILREPMDTEVLFLAEIPEVVTGPFPRLEWSQTDSISLPGSRWKPLRYEGSSFLHPVRREGRCRVPRCPLLAKRPGEVHNQQESYDRATAGEAATAPPTVAIVVLEEGRLGIRDECAAWRRAAPGDAAAGVARANRAARLLAAGCGGRNRALRAHTIRVGSADHTCIAHAGASRHVTGPRHRSQACDGAALPARRLCHAAHDRAPAPPGDRPVRGELPQRPGDAAHVTAMVHPGAARAALLKRRLHRTPRGLARTRGAAVICPPPMAPRASVAFIPVPRSRASRLVTRIARGPVAVTAMPRSRAARLVARVPRGPVAVPRTRAPRLVARILGSRLVMGATRSLTAALRRECHIPRIPTARWAT